MSFYHSSRSFRVMCTRAIQWRRNMHSSIKLNSRITDGGQGTHKPTPFQERVLVWTKTYKSVGDIPERISTSQMKNAFDKFRVRVSIAMVCLTFIFAAIMAVIGRRERLEGKTMSKISMQRREQ